MKISQSMDLNPFNLKFKAATATYPHFIDLFSLSPTRLDEVIFEAPRRRFMST